MKNNSSLYLTSLMLLLCFLILDCATTNKEEMKPNAKKYTLVWSDEFEQDGPPNPANWTYEQGFKRNEELQWYQAENAFCKDGILVIEGRRDTFPNPNYNPASDDWRLNRKEVLFTSANVTTKGLHNWTYGRFEIKARIKTIEGLWPAIWMLGENHEWPVGGEIDIMEFYGGNILANAAWAGTKRYQAIWDDSRKPVASFAATNWSDQFHIWRMDWTEQSIKIYLDEELLNTIPLDETINQRGSIKNPFRETKQFLLLNLAIGGMNGGDTSNTPFPSRYEIDYVRVYQMQP